MDESQFVEKADPDEVFGLLADETRVDILRALWESHGDPVPFSDLREAVGIRDSGQFNYHLDKLVSQFVRRNDEGYELAYAGVQVIGALEAGAYTVKGNIEPIELSAACRTCGGKRTIRYENEQVVVTCDTCPVTSQYGVPPRVLAGADREELPAVAGEYLRTICQQLDRGFCWNCETPIDATVEAIEMPDEEIPEPARSSLTDGFEGIPIVEYNCDQCGGGFSGGLRMMLLSHPAVAGFLHENGREPDGERVWGLATFSPAHERLEREEPLQASARFTAGDDELTVVVDSEFTIVDIERA